VVFSESGNGRKNMMRSVEESLRRLDTDRIDVFFLHARDGITPWEEIMRALDDLVHAGKVLYVAVSDTPAWEISRANMLAELRGWSAFVGIQIEYSLVQRTPERDLLPMASALGLGITAWAPLAGGALSGKYTAVSSAEPTRLADGRDQPADARDSLARSPTSRARSEHRPRRSPWLGSRAARATGRSCRFSAPERTLSSSKISAAWASRSTPKSSSVWTISDQGGARLPARVFGERDDAQVPGGWGHRLAALAPKA
jgi:aryl-alcohol dehydrogenase-like predicted oxidoreductase